MVSELQKTRGFGAFSVDPLVLVVPTYTFRIGDGTILDWLDQVVPDRKKLILIQPLWSIEHVSDNPQHGGLSGVRWLELVDWTNQYRGTGAVVLLANTERDAEISNSYGLQSVFINHNCFVDENVFAINNSSDIEFDAVYIARMSPVKRHYLARDIARLALVYRHSFEGDDITFNYYNEVTEWLPQAVYLNGAFSRDGQMNTHRDLTKREVAQVCNRAHVGLCLSAVEGACWASMEYLLCGLPVVTTKSLGGRDVFFTAENAIVCNDNSAEIRDAVDGLISECRSREFIRDQVLALVAEHRRRFVNLISSFAPHAGMSQVMHVVRTGAHGCQLWNLQMLQDYLEYRA